MEKKSVDLRVMDLGGGCVRFLHLSEMSVRIVSAAQVTLHLVEG